MAGFGVRWLCVDMRSSAAAPPILTGSMSSPTTSGDKRNDGLEAVGITSQAVLINLTKGIRQKKRLFRHHHGEFKIVCVLGIKDAWDMTHNQSAGDNSAGCRVNMQDRE